MKTYNINSSDYTMVGKTFAQGCSNLTLKVTFSSGKNLFLHVYKDLKILLMKFRFLFILIINIIQNDASFSELECHLGSCFW